MHLWITGCERWQQTQIESWRNAHQQYTHAKTKRSSSQIIQTSSLNSKRGTKSSSSQRSIPDWHRRKQNRVYNRSWRQWKHDIGQRNRHHIWFLQQQWNHTGYNSTSAAQIHSLQLNLELIQHVHQWEG